MTKTEMFKHLPSLKVPKEKIIDTSGAGDVFHGAYCASYLERPDDPLAQPFHFLLEQLLHIKYSTLAMRLVSPHKRIF